MKVTAIEEETIKCRPDLSTGAMEDCGNGAVRRIEQSIDYMAQHLDKPLQVATLAAQVNISPSHFFALFKRRIGRAPMDYFTRLRMQRACRLLERTSLSVKEVASELGYDDPFYFSRVFKSVNRMAPSDYRAAQREMAGATGEDGKGSNYAREPKTARVSGRIQFA
jgi:transcriptional regulator GlxA family with amidase domain